MERYYPYCVKACRDWTECGKCEWRCPDLWPENRESWELWNVAKTQWRTGVMGAGGMIGPCPVGLDYVAVYQVAKTLNIDITPGLLYCLQALEFYELNSKPGGGDDVGG